MKSLHYLLVVFLLLSAANLDCSEVGAQIVEPIRWAEKDGRVVEIDEFHFDDAALVSPRLDGRAAFFGQRVLCVVSIAKIQKELGISPEQNKRIQNTYNDSVGLALDANRKLGEATLKIASDLRKEGILSQEKFDELSEVEREKCRKRYREIDSTTTELLANILTDEQLKRLKEIVLQADIHQFGIAKTVELRKEELKVEEKQTKALKVQSNSLENEFKSKLKKMQEEKREKLLKILTPEQRRKLKELQGKPAEFETKK